MKKIVKTNKTGCIILTGYFALLISCFVSIVFSLIFNELATNELPIYVSFIIVLVLICPSFILLWKKIVSKSIWKVEINGSCFVYESIEGKFNIDMTTVLDFEIEKSNNGVNIIFKYNYDNEGIKHFLYFGAYNVIQREFDKLPKMKQVLKDKKTKIYFKELIKKNVDKIITSFIGLGISILAFILYFNNKDNNILTIILSIICVLYGMITFYACYLRKSLVVKDRFINKLILLIGSSVVYFALMLICLEIIAEGGIEIKKLMLCILFTYPSFIILPLLVAVAFG